MTRRRSKNTRRLQTSIPLAALLAIFLFTLWLATLEFLSDPNLAARVLYSETAGTSQRERLLVAGVMQNRIHNPPFGNAPNLHAVVAQPGAFSCIDDGNNANWRKTRHPDQLTPNERAIWQNCLAIVSHPIPAAYGPSGRPLVYYHDKSITKPRSWDNTKWRAIREITTEHFIFYSILPAPPAAPWFKPQPKP